MRVERCPYCRELLSRCRCKGRAADVLVWVGIFILGSMVFMGCGSPGADWSPIAATSMGELFIVDETIRFSRMTSQRVTGEISTHLYSLACPPNSGLTPPCHAFGWYVGDYGPGSKGVAYYYQPDIPKYSDAILSGAAAHEVCHSVTGPEHNTAHSACISKNNVVVSASFVCLTPLIARGEYELK
jgi:hypothetical protein